MELVTSICDAMEDDLQKTNNFAIASNFGWFPLHFCCCWNTTTNVEVLQLVIDQFPKALVVVNDYSRYALFTVQTFGTDSANHEAILRFLTDNTDKYLALENQITVKLCLVRLKTEGMTESVANIPQLIDLTREQFVFMSLDNMQNRMMQATAEDILSYVGVNTSDFLLTMMFVSRRKEGGEGSGWNGLGAADDGVGRRRRRRRQGGGERRVGVERVGESVDACPLGGRCLHTLWISNQSK